MPVHAAAPGVATFARQAAEDWKAFLEMRACEMRPAARLVVVLPGRNDDGLTGFEDLMDHANTALREMMHEGEIRAEEHERMVLASYPRRKTELLAPVENSASNTTSYSRCPTPPGPITSSTGT